MRAPLAKTTTFILFSALFLQSSAEDVCVDAGRVDQFLSLPTWPDSVSVDRFSFVEFSKLYKGNPFNENSQYVPSLMWGWAPVYGYRLSRYLDARLVFYEADDTYFFFEPISDEKILAYEALQSLSRRLIKEKNKFTFGVLSDKSVQDLASLRNDAEAVLQFEKMVDLREYVYDTKSISQLTGSKFSKKRTEVNFYERTSGGNRVAIEGNAKVQKDCLDFLQVWMSDQIELFGDDFARLQSLQEEVDVTKRFLMHFDSVALNGLAAYDKSNRLTGFAFGVGMSGKVFVGISLKANREVRGSYQILHRDMARMALEKGYVQYNVQDDAGVEALRKSKMSYDPEHFIEVNSIGRTLY